MSEFHQALDLILHRQPSAPEELTDIERGLLVRVSALVDANAALLDKLVAERQTTIVDIRNEAVVEFLAYSNPGVLVSIMGPPC